MCGSTPWCGCAGSPSSARSTARAHGLFRARFSRCRSGPVSRVIAALGMAQRGTASALPSDAAAGARPRRLAPGLRHRRTGGALVSHRRTAEPVFAFLFLGPGAAVGDRAAAALHADARRLCLSPARPCWCFAHYPLPWDRRPSARSAADLHGRASGSRSCSPSDFIGVYAWQITEESRPARPTRWPPPSWCWAEQHLSQLDGLAAAAAHELGTPLSTISVIAKELDERDSRRAPHGEDVRLLREQTARCRDILGRSPNSRPAASRSTACR